MADAVAGIALLKSAAALSGEEFLSERQLEDAAHLIVARPRGLVFKEPGPQRCLPRAAANKSQAAKREAGREASIAPVRDHCL